VYALNRAQALLEQIYALNVPLAIEDFLVTDRRLANALDDSPAARDCDEKLLLLEDADGLCMSLFIDEALLERLAQDDPTDCLNEHNLADFCIALEGVSHFMYVAHRAGQDRPVTLLELELQAEVDKYVGVQTTLNSQGTCGAPHRLLRRMFEQVSFDRTLDDDARSRYRGANAYARRYCRHLERQFVGRSPVRFVSEVRHFHALAQLEKLRHIDTNAML
jgi:hypothetical protein